MAIYTDPNSNPQPYEEAMQTIPRYTGGPAIEKRQASRKFPLVVKSQSVQSTQQSKRESYYSRPKFFKKGRNYSTSTHIYGEIGSVNTSDESSMYISPGNLEPFLPPIVDHQITEKDLMLGNLDESITSYTSTDYLPSGSEEGSLSDEFDQDQNKEEEEDEEEEEMEEEDDEGEQGSNEYSLNEPSSWMGKSPATGQVKPQASDQEEPEPEYINTRLKMEAEGELYEAKYVNTRAAAATAAAIAAATANSKPLSTKSVPSRIKKKQRKNKHNKSLPMIVHQGQDENDEYTGLTPNTGNYTSVYVSVRHQTKQDTPEES